MLRYYGDSGSFSQGPGEGETVIDDEYNEARAIGGGAWWLRSPGSDRSLAAAVDKDGVIQVGGYPITQELGLRPAAWVDITQ